MMMLSAYMREGGAFSFRIIIHIIAPAPRLTEAPTRGIADEMQHFANILVIRIALFGFFNPIIKDARFTKDQAKGAA